MPKINSRSETEPDETNGKKPESDFNKAISKRFQSDFKAISLSSLSDFAVILQ
jgi:hypothetical protein